MTPSSFLGLLGTLVGLIRALPQLTSILKAKSALGVSIDTAATSACVSFGWAVYGLWTDQFFVSLATGASGVVFLLVTIFALKFGHRIRELKVAPLWICFLMAAAMAGHEKGLAILLPVSVLAANIPQLRVAARETNLSDLSLGTWLLSLSDGFIWGLYSLLEQDPAIFAFALFQLSTSAVIIILKLAKKTKPT